MKMPPHSSRRACLAGFLVLTASLFAADPAPPAPMPEPPGPLRTDEGPGRRPVPRGTPRRDAVETKRVTFLGVQVVGVPPVLGAQLGLSPETGLAVGHVAARSPAAGVLKQHDVLTQLEDQVLIDARQLAVLVHNHKEGEEVSLTLFRAGRKMQVKVRLASQEVPRPAEALDGPPGMGPFGPGRGRGMGPGAGGSPMNQPRDPEERPMPGRMVRPEGRRGPDGPAMGPMSPKAI